MGELDPNREIHDYERQVFVDAIEALEPWLDLATPTPKELEAQKQDDQAVILISKTSLFKVRDLLLRVGIMEIIDDAGEEGISTEMTWMVEYYRPSPAAADKGPTEYFYRIDRANDDADLEASYDEFDPEAGSDSSTAPDDYVTISYEGFTAAMPPRRESWFGPQRFTEEIDEDEHPLEVPLPQRFTAARFDIIMPLLQQLHPVHLAFD